MSARVFVDTNVLVYAKDASVPEKQAQAWHWLEGLWRERTGRISVQVCNEYFVTVTQKLRPGLAPEAAWADLTRHQAWEPLPLTWAVLSFARETQTRYHLSWWDSLIVAAARAAECSVLLSEDLGSGQEYWGIRVVSPFAGRG